MNRNVVSLQQAVDLMILKLAARKVSTEPIDPLWAADGEMMEILFFF